MQEKPKIRLHIPIFHVFRPLNLEGGASQVQLKSILYLVGLTSVTLVNSYLHTQYSKAILKLLYTAKFRLRPHKPGMHTTLLLFSLLHTTAEAKQQVAPTAGH